MNLYEAVTEQLNNPRISALVIEEEMEPAKGPHAAVAPPTYASATRGGPSEFAVTDGVVVPARDSSGWHRSKAEDSPEGAHGSKRVVLNSLGGCADASETGLHRNQARLGLTLPGIILDGTLVSEERVVKALQRSKTKVSDRLAKQIRAALRFRISTWALGHRMADSWVMFSTEPGANGQQVWATDSEVRQVIQNIGHPHGDNVYRYGPNAAVFGNWLSSGTAQRQAIPRAYSCEIIGFGAREAARGATKLDRTGGATNTGRKLTATEDGIKTGTGGKEPSKLGFGQVPSQVATRAFTCAVILRQASVSLRALDRFVYSDDDSHQKAFAAKRVYTLIAMTGHLLAQEDGFLRSECDLVTVQQRWGWRSHGQREPVEFETPTLEDAAEALRQAIEAAAQLGLEFAEPIEVTLSDAQIDLIIDRVAKESAVEAATSDET